MSRLVHAGSAVVDYVYRIDALPSPGTEKTATSHGRVAGGGFNLMAAARRAGMEVAYAGRHGTGTDGDFLRAAFAMEKIDVLMPPSKGRDSGNSVVLITGDAERTFVSWPGAESKMSAADFAPVALRAGDWVSTSGYTVSYPDSREALADWIEALPAGIPLVFDPAPVVADIPKPVLARVLARVTWLSCNDAEAAIIAGADTPGDNARRLIERHCPTAAGVVIRSGEAGALLLLHGGAPVTVPGFEVVAVDTNGAGDTHIGALVRALARGDAPLTAIRYANAAAAIAVTRHGGSSAPTDAEIREFLAARRDEAPVGGPTKRMTA